MTSLTYQKTANATGLIAVAATLTMPDAVFGLLLELSHLMLELAHLLFELLESSLDHLVEHLFETDTRETQVIVFYLIMTMASAAIYYLCRTVRRFFRKLKENVQTAYFQYKDSILGYWAESATNKFKLIAGFNVALTFVYLLGF